VLEADKPLGMNFQRSLPMETMCACGSGKMYGNCCKPYHAGSAKPPTAVELMRSRYSAFVYGAIDYLVATTLPAKRTPKTRAHYQATFDSTKWIGLEIIRTHQGEQSDKTGKVEVRARFDEEGGMSVQHA